MAKMQAKAIQELRSEIKRHDILYYQKAHPEISDYEYDLLKQKLKKLEGYSVSHESPLNQVGDDRIEGFVTYKHRTPMLSIDNSYDFEDLKDFDKRLKKVFNKDLEYIVEPKIDGVAVSLTYEKGKFIRAVTRGNGTEGDDITHNVKTIKSLPRTLNGKDLPKIIEVRGEIYITNKDFEKINEERDLEGLPVYANPRNLAAGTVKLLDSKQAAKRNLNIVMHGIGYCEPEHYKAHENYNKLLESWSLPVLEKIWYVVGIDAVWKSIEELHTLRFSYQTDGAVVKLKNISERETVGYTAKAPRWAIAYKFEPERAETKLLSISIQVGRTGVLTPVAELEPVHLSGTTVSRATLHNEEEIKRKDVRIGDTVLVEKAGEIIPAVISVNTKKRPSSSKPFEFPKQCPSCGTDVIKLEGEVAWRCPNAACPPQVRRRIIHFASRQAMNIKDLGKAIVDQLVTNGLCKDIADIYELKKEQVLPLEKFAEKSASNLIVAINESKQQQLWRLIHGLGIPNIGQQSAKDLAKHFKSLKGLMVASEEELIAIEGIGSIVAQSIISFFKEPHNQRLIQRLIENNLSTEIETVHTTSQKLSGKTFVITGTIEGVSRDIIKEEIETAGGHVSSSVSKKTDYLLAGKSPGSKFEKAKELNVKIIDYDSLKQLL